MLRKYYWNLYFSSKYFSSRKYRLKSTIFRIAQTDKFRLRFRQKNQKTRCFYLLRTSSVPSKKKIKIYARWSFLGLSLSKLCAFFFCLTYFYAILADNPPALRGEPILMRKASTRIDLRRWRGGGGCEAAAITVKEMYSQLIVMVRKACIGVP